MNAAFSSARARKESTFGDQLNMDLVIGQRPSATNRSAAKHRCLEMRFLPGTRPRLAVGKRIVS
jgi:hypothetical protein